MSTFIDLTGQQYGQLFVMDRAENSIKGEARWNCLCVCGSEVCVPARHLKSGNTKSCGCFKKESNRAHSLTHGMSSSPEYVIWSGIKQRCYNQNNPDYHHYGERGITVCDEWKESFESFYRDMGPRPSARHTVERKDNDKGYSKENCCWATQIEQSNNRRTNIFYVHNDTAKTMKTWCRELGLNYHTVRARLQKGMSFEDAIRS